MWIELPALWIVVLNCLGIPAAHLLNGWWSTLLPARFFPPESMLYRSRSWERGGEVYIRLFRVRGWKHLLPDAAPWFRGFAKGQLASRDPSYLRTFVVETCRGEFSHWVQIAVIAAFIAWNPWPANLVIIAYSLLANLPCIVNLRHTRARMRRVLNR